VHAECDYRRPLKFEENLEIHLLVREKRPKVLSYLFKFRKPTATGEMEQIAHGILTVVCVAHYVDGTMTSAPIPDFLAKQIEVAPPELLA
jgi:acyl-CoA thioesterase FadM